MLDAWRMLSAKDGALLARMHPTGYTVGHFKEVMFDEIA
jgi:hypothetical protein